VIAKRLRRCGACPQVEDRIRGEVSAGAAAVGWRGGGFALVELCVAGLRGLASIAPGGKAGGRRRAAVSGSGSLCHGTLVCAYSSCTHRLQRQRRRGPSASQHVSGARSSGKSGKRLRIVRHRRTIGQAVQTTQDAPRSATPVLAHVPTLALRCAHRFSRMRNRGDGSLLPRVQLDKQEKLRQKWHGTEMGKALQEIRHLHGALAHQSAQEQEMTRERIAELVQALRQGGVYGKYDPPVGFVEEKAATKPRRKR